MARDDQLVDGKNESKALTENSLCGTGLDRPQRACATSFANLSCSHSSAVLPTRGADLLN